MGLYGGIGYFSSQLPHVHRAHAWPNAFPIRPAWQTGDKEGAKKARRSMLQARLEKKLPTFTSPGKKGRKATRQNKLKVQTS